MEMQKRLDATFAALADPTRRAILARLAKGEASVLELAEPIAISQPAISKAVRLLEQQTGAQLLVRAPSGVVLTDAGKLLLEHARARAENTSTDARTQVREE